MSKLIMVLAAVAIGLMFTGRALACDTAEGSIAKIDSSKAMLVVQKSGCCPSTGDGQMTFVLKKDTKVLVNGKSATLADLRAGDKVQVQFEKLDDVLAVTATRQS
jgi:hypothetical protein